MSVVLTPSTRSQRQRLVRLGAMILLASLPIAAILVALVNWPVGLGFVVVWTVGLLFGVGQQRTSTLRVDAAGLQYEAGTFVLRAAWADIDRIGEASLPTAKTQAFVLRSSGLRWTRSAQVRQQVSTRGWDRIIPIDEFAPRWPAGRLGDAVRAHRPDLLTP
ncbi:MAG: hypothetical protein KDA97_02030 [Acidimicrobiales bacterium]|nr:hypothetical protein [Acidimicrobiales bacterium]